MKTLAISGIITGLVISGWMYLEFLAGFHGSEVGGYTGFAALLFTILGIYFGIRSYRNRVMAGKINFWQGVLAGVVISVFAGLITAVFTFVYFRYINPGFVDFMVNIKREALEQQGASDVQIQSSEIITRESLQPLTQALRAFGGYLAAGSLFSLIIAGLLKTKRQDEA
jgi:uncharacterized membrane protein (DUF485 family)